MPLPTEIACSSCDYFSAFGDDERGTCRRYAPRARPEPEEDGDDNVPSNVAQWPIVFVGEWCGEYVARPE